MMRWYENILVILTIIIGVYLFLKGWHLDTRKLILKIMKPIFTRNTDIRKTAFLNWRIIPSDGISNLHVLADGFLSSAIELAKLAVADNSDNKADKLIFPI